MDTDVLAKVRGDDLTVRCGVDHNIILACEAMLVYEGEFEY